MIRKQSDIALISSSVRVYQVLLVAYPTKFQQEYGLHMVQVFRDCCLRAFQQSGTFGILKLWVITLIDLLSSALAEHLQKEALMKKEMKPEDIYLAGWGLILGGVALTICMSLALLGGSLFSELPEIVLPILCLPLFVIGLLAIRSRYRKAVGTFGKNILLAGAILGPLTSVIGLVLTGMARASWTPQAELGWALIVGGPAVLLACLTLFGIAILYKRPLPGWNTLPFLAGLWYPSFFIAWFVAFLNTGEPSNSVAEIPHVILVIIFALQGIAIVALGYVLKSDVPEEMAVSA